jgi:hypothetical protein
MVGERTGQREQEIEINYFNLSKIMDIEKMKLKSWQGWLLFFGAMAAVFVMGILAASITESGPRSFLLTRIESGYCGYGVSQRGL